MRAQRVLRPLRSIDEVQASLATFGGPVADRLDQRPHPEGGASVAFSYRQVFDDLGRDLESLRREVVAAEDEHVRRQALATSLRREAEALGKELYDQQVAVRQVLAGAFGRDRGFELAAISGVTPRTLKPLEEQVDQTVKLLREPRVEEPAVRVAGVEVDLDRVAGGLAAKLEEFRSVRAALDRARKAVAESKVLLDRALDRFQSSFPWIARALEAHFRRAGEHGLADRVRTSIRRVTRRQAEPPESQLLPSEPPQSEPEEQSAETASAVETSSGDTAPSVAVLPPERPADRRPLRPVPSPAAAVLRSARRWFSPEPEPGSE